ncbi:RagB/SusD family nutrient uptake outer membrane protein [Chitinophaga sp. B61]|uniref:RagB/SusD family nutrient uptake outer membrane protein n=2 Tax=Chitinophaga rhizophila TaxID=2866212 RepID=A0ABS7G7Y5_9BACT|nr:RagB/SusD family nutrient uptake outer membrane protein [Chitinophaga rhizophila]
MTIPETVDHYQSLLDFSANMNADVPVYGEASADNYYVTDTRFSVLVLADREAYLWRDKMFPAVVGRVLDWSTQYIRVNYCNTVLAGLKGVSGEAGTAAYNNVKGSALFFRAFSFYVLAEVFCKAYDSTTATNDLGLPLRTTDDVKQIFPRASLKETYDQIFNDLYASIPLLPDIGTVKTRPSRAAAYALLSRMNLILGNYSDAKRYADSSLVIHDKLLDYNTVEDVGASPFDKFNPEVIFYATMTGTPLILPGTSGTDTALLNQFAEDDLRKILFFRPGTVPGFFSFKGSYSENPRHLFGGIATDEIYLTRAECYAREGDVDRATADLNKLLRMRWKSGKYVELTIKDPEIALRTVLAERRKQLMFRGRRFPDLRRLNKDPRFSTTVIRSVNGVLYQLPPNDPRYVLPIPEDEIIVSGIQQNER